MNAETKRLLQGVAEGLLDLSLTVLAVSQAGKGEDAERASLDLVAQVLDLKATLDSRDPGAA